MHSPTQSFSSAAGVEAAGILVTFIPPPSASVTAAQNTVAACLKKADEKAAEADTAKTGADAAGAEAREAVAATAKAAEAKEEAVAAKGEASRAFWAASRAFETAAGALERKTTEAEAVAEAEERKKHLLKTRRGCQMG
jgi:hypothetical protein